MTNPKCPHGHTYGTCLMCYHDLVAEQQSEIERLRGNLSMAEEGLANYALEVKQLTGDRAQDQQRLFHYEGAIAEQRAAIEQLHAAVRTAQELAARRLMEIERLRKDLRECRSHLTDVIASQDRPAIKAAADWLSDWEGTRIDPGSAPEPFEQLPAQLAWGLESKLPGEDWKVYWALYSDRDRAEQAAKNGRPEGTEWRVVTYARMPEGASRDASSEKSETVKDSCGPGCAMGANRPAQKSDEIRDLACCDKFVRESASEFCAICGYTNLDHLRKRSSSRT